MRVAFVTELFPPHVGGQEFRFSQFAKLLISKGWSVDVYTIKHQRSLPEYERLDKISIYRYITLTDYVKPGSRAPIPLLKYIIKTRKLIETIHTEYDVLLVNEMPILHLYAIPRYDNLVVDVCEVHSKGLLRIMTNNPMKHLKHAIAVSDFIGEWLKKINKEAKVETIRTPLKISEYFSNPDKKEPYTILYVGRLVPHKNVLNLAKAVIKIRTSNDKLRWRLIVVGSGERYLENLISKLSERYEFIEYLGYVREGEKRELFKRAWLFAIPSIREGFPNSVAEAVASSTPVLVVKCPNSGLWYEVLKYRIGKVCSDASSEYLARCLADIDEDTYFRYVEGTYKLRREFDESYVYAKLSFFLTKVVNHESFE
ncbi:MAG: glycosyltransferase family 4 protein [Sulfolobales archaeon]